MSFFWPIISGKLQWCFFYCPLIFLFGQIEIAAQTLPETKNAADLYRLAFANLEKLSPLEKKLLNGVRINETDTKKDLEQVDYSKLLVRLKPSIELVHSASNLNHVDWQTNGESSQWIELGSMSKQLMRALILQARFDIKKSQYHEAVNHCLSGMAFSRHLGQDGVFIVRLIEASTFKIIANFCAQELPEFPGSEVTSLLERIKKLPPSKTAKETFQAENRYSFKLSQQKGSPYPKDLIDGYVKFYDEVVAAGDLSPDKFENQLKVIADSYPDNLMVKAIVPMLPHMKEKIAAHEVTMELFELGLNVLVHGAQAVKDSSDPFGGGTYEYTQQPSDSFELSSQFTQRGEKLKLRFGR